MKKASIVLLMVFLMALTFTGGFFLGRGMNRSTVRISEKATTAPIITTTIPSTTANPDSKVNINTASVLELSTLPTIGEVIAQRIVEYREEHGPFQTVGELASVEGIGQKRLETILELITVGGQS